MNGVFEEAKCVDLPALAAYLGLRPSGGAIESPCCGGHRVSMTRDRGRPWRWRCEGCGSGGTAIDFVGRVRNLPPLRAARSVVATVRKHPELVLAVEAESSVDAGACAEVAAALVNMERLDAGVVAYLSDRGVSEAVVRDAFAEGWLRSLPHGDPERVSDLLVRAVGGLCLEAAGLLRLDGTVTIDRMPLVFVTADAAAAEFRRVDGTAGPKAIQVGVARTPIASPGSPTTTQCVVVGSGMEMLAYRELGLVGSDATLLGGCGPDSWRGTWVEWLAERRPLVNRVEVALKAGPELARVQAGFASAGLVARASAPPGDSDWGETLAVVRA